MIGKRVNLTRPIAWLAVLLAGVVVGIMGPPISEPAPFRNWWNAPIHPLRHETLEAIGIRHGAPGPTIRPLLSKRRAIDIAKESIGPAQASGIFAQFVLFSDDDFTGVDAQGNYYSYLKVPAWVVTVEGLYLPSTGPGQPSYNTELNVVINDVTGEILEEFSYK